MTFGVIFDLVVRLALVPLAPLLAEPARLSHFYQFQNY
jgi:hypothetical protein